MAFVRALRDLTPAELSVVGGKARSCAELLRAGYDVPDGFVVHCAADSLPLNEMQVALRNLGEGPLAVRSSAVDEDGARHSFAGVHETTLGVTASQVAEAVRQSLLSMTSAAAQSYRRSRGLSAPVGAQSVLVQRLVPAVVAGVGFTVDPVNARSAQLVISASWGSGEAVVGGLVEADEIRVHRASRGIVAQYVGGKAYRLVADGRESMRVPTTLEEQSRLCLDAAQVAALTELLLSIEQHFGLGQDVEWCHDGQRFWILQSRPITVTASSSSLSSIEWTRTNVREVLPDLPSPQALELLSRLVNNAMHGYFGALLAPVSELGPMIKTIGGRAYFNLSQFRHLARAAMIPPGLFMKAMGHADGLSPEDMKIKIPPLREVLRNLPVLVRIGYDQIFLYARMRKLFRASQDAVRKVRRIAAADRSDEQMLAILEDFGDQGQEALRTAFASGGALHWHLVLEALCHRFDFPVERLMNTQLAVGEKTVSSQQAFDMLALANIGRNDERVRQYFATQAETDPRFERWGKVLRGSLFKRELTAFIDTYGHRGVHESDWALPRYSEDPTPVLFALGQLVNAAQIPTPAGIDARLRREADDTWREFAAAVPSTWREVTLPFVRWVLRHVKTMYLYRERNRYEMIRGMEPMRELTRELARRFTARRWIEREDDFYLLTLDEVAAAVRDAAAVAALPAVVRARQAELARFRNLDMPLYLREEDIPAVLDGAVEPAVDRSPVLRVRGLCTSPGRVEAPVLIMRDPNEFARMQPGVILVAPATDPSWTPLFTLAAGVIVEIGGSLSHASTIAREYGLPALANVKDATRLLVDGEMVRLDATAGYVERLGANVGVQASRG